MITGWSASDRGRHRRRRRSAGCCLLTFSQSDANDAAGAATIAQGGVAVEDKWLPWVLIAQRSQLSRLHRGIETVASNRPTDIVSVGPSWSEPPRDGSTIAPQAAGLKSRQARCGSTIHSPSRMIRSTKNLSIGSPDTGHSHDRIPENDNAGWHIVPVAIGHCADDPGLRLGTGFEGGAADFREAPIGRLGDVAGVGVVTVLSALVLVLLAFGAGLVARTYSGERLTRWFEGSLLGRLPQYQMVKNMTEGLARLESASGIKPALISIEGGWQMGYLLEPLENGWLSVSRRRRRRRCRAMSCICLPNASGRSTSRWSTP